MNSLDGFSSPEQDISYALQYSATGDNLSKNVAISCD
jgi:hypothetical protein